MRKITALELQRHPVRAQDLAIRGPIAITHRGRSRVVLLAFDDRQQFARWSRSPEYTRIALDRKAGSDAVVLLTEGAQ